MEAEHLEIRTEIPPDLPALDSLNQAAFGGPQEARLLHLLRQAGALSLSLVALRASEILGHIAFSPVRIGAATSGNAALALAPMAVHPRVQRQGIGSRLVTAGLAQATALGAPLVIVLGHPEFYPRFGFVPASPLGILCPFEAPPEAFMVRELKPGAIAAHHGTVRYHPAFDAFT